tara:strand:+ start:595 stop:1881 length:1287 start_codon:yes stop_codon:yes gene_type:complete
MIALNLPTLKFKIVINFLISLLPLSFIAGNLVINLNITLIILISLFFWKKEFFNIKINLIDKLLILLFIFSIITGLINYNSFLSNNPSLAKENLIKSFTLFRYLFFYFSIRLIIEKDYFNFKTFFLSSSICVVFVSLDLILQFYLGKDIFGYPKSDHKLSGPFGDELIAGSYLQRFSLFLFFFTYFYKKFSNKINLYSILFFLFALVFFSVIIAGNRMSTILFVMMFVILFLVEKKLRKFIVILIPLIFLVFFSLYNLYPYIQDTTNHFIKISSQIIFSFDQIFNSPDLNFSNMYLKEFHLGYMTWKENVLIGGGINSFYLNCEINYDICTSHPHNYYFEILSELGIIGMVLISTIFINLIYLFLKIKNNFTFNYNNYPIVVFASIFFVEIFPLKTTGSFFTTGNASYIFLLMAVVVGLSNKLGYYKI